MGKYNRIYWKNSKRENVDDRVRERIDSTSSDEWSDLEIDFGDSVDRLGFFDDIQNYVEVVMRKNGRYKSKRKGRLLDFFFDYAILSPLIE